MRRPILRYALTILIVAAPFIGRDVHAAGQVTGVAVSPNPATKPSTGSAAVAVTISGTGSCAEIEVDYGDTNLQRLPVAQFPLTLTHSYGGSGQFRVAARGARDCAGAVQTTLTVGRDFAASILGLAGRLGKFERTCLLVQCRCALPTIDKIVPFVSFPEPGGTIVLQGCGFGTDRNVFGLFLHLVDYRRRPLAPIELRVLSLRNDTVVAEIPFRISGVLDQPANLEARRSGQVGPLFSVGFHATPDVALLSWNDPVVQLLPEFSVSDADANFFWQQDTFASSHMNLHRGDQSGTDAWAIELSNDWVFDQFWFTRNVDPGELQV